MAGILVKRWEGTDGRVTFPDIGALIGYFSGWHLVLHEKDQTYTLRATFGYLNRKLWESTDYERQITVEMGRGRKVTLEQTESGEIKLDGNQLELTGVKPWRQPEA